MSLPAPGCEGGEPLLDWAYSDQVRPD
jgi:hypothetical protein